MRFFLDASFVVALELTNDNKHGAARSFWNELDEKNAHFVTTGFVLAEILAYLNGFGLHRKSAEVGNWLLFNPAVELVIPGRREIVDGYDYLVRHRDKRYLVTDCLSFILMRKMRLDAALTFDRHFAQAGFAMLPEEKA